MSDIIKTINHDYTAINKYIDEKARQRRTKSVWNYTRSLVLFLIGLGFFLILISYAYHIFNKPNKIIETFNNKTNTEKVIDGEIIKYNSTTHQFETHTTGEGFSIITRREYETTKDLLEKTENYIESCYIEKNYNTIEFNIPLNIQVSNIKLIGLNQSEAANLEKYCKYTK